MEEIRVLGAYGTKGSEHETSSFLINSSHVIDAGNLLKSLGQDTAKIDAIWLTHSHLDHIVDIAYILDSCFTLRQNPLKIMGLPKTIEAIKKHFLNNIIWPDFSKIVLPNTDKMSVEYIDIEIGKKYFIDEDISIEAITTIHSVPSCGYIVRKNGSAVLITADTYKNPELCSIINKYPEITTLVIECSFPSSMNLLALESMHLTPSLIIDEIECVQRELNIYLNHLKPPFLEEIKKELFTLDKLKDATVLDDGEIVYF